MRKMAMILLLLAAACMSAAPSSAADSRDNRKAVPDSAIDMGGGIWKPSASPVTYYGYPRSRIEAVSPVGPYVSTTIGGTEMNDVEVATFHHGYYNPGIIMLGAAE